MFPIYIPYIQATSTSATCLLVSIMAALTFSTSTWIITCPTRGAYTSNRPYIYGISGVYSPYIWPIFGHFFFWPCLALYWPWGAIYGYGRSQNTPGYFRRWPVLAGSGWLWPVLQRFWAKTVRSDPPQHAPGARMTVVSINSLKTCSLRNKLDVELWLI